MGKYNEGDLVRLVKGDTVLQGRVADVHGKGRGWDMVLPLVHLPKDLNQAVFMDWYEREGFDIEVIEPKLELPTEHGIYVSGDYARIYVLDEDGWTYYRHGLATRRTEEEMIEALQNVDGTKVENLIRMVPEAKK